MATAVMPDVDHKVPQADYHEESQEYAYPRAEDHYRDS